MPPRFELLSLLAVTLLLGAAALAAGCSAERAEGPDPGDAPGAGPRGHADGDPAGGFPAEKAPSDFPGVSYPGGSGSLPRPGSLNGPVWLIGIDGATWDLIRPLAERGELPNFKKLMEQGAHATLLSEEPTISAAIWTTIATGMPRFEHGIVNFTVKRPGSYDVVEAGPSDRRSPALWELVGAAGGSSAVISWWCSYPAEKIQGYYLSKRFDPEHLRADQVHPGDFIDRLSRNAMVRMRRGDLSLIGVTETFRNTLLDDARGLAALRVIAAESRPDLVAVYFAGIDVVQHLTWRHMDPDSNAFPEDGDLDPLLAQVVPAYYAYLDHSLGEIRQLAPDDATIIVVSDHGGGPLGREEAVLLQLPMLLEELGLMQGRAGEAFAISELYRHDKRVWLNLEGVEAAGVVPLERAEAVARALQDRLERMHTGGGQPVFTSIVRHTAEPGWQPGDPALTVRFSLAAREAKMVFDGDRAVDMSRVRGRIPGNSGSHRLEGILLMHGPGVRPGRLAEPANIYQLAPTVLYLLGLPQDARMLRYAPESGGVITQALEPELLARHPVVMVDEYAGTDRAHLLRSRSGSDTDQVDPSHHEAMKRLRDLGYIR